MQIILCRSRRSASGKRAIWRAKDEWFKNALGATSFSTGDNNPVSLRPRVSSVETEAPLVLAPKPLASRLSTPKGATRHANRIGRRQLARKTGVGQEGRIG